MENYASSPELSNSAPEANFAKVKISNFFKKIFFLLLFHVSKLRRNTVDLKNINITDLNPIFKKLEIFLSVPKALLGPYF